MYSLMFKIEKDVSLYAHSILASKLTRIMRQLLRAFDHNFVSKKTTLHAHKQTLDTLQMHANACKKTHTNYVSITSCV